VKQLSPLIQLNVVQYSVVDDTVAEFKSTHVPSIVIQGSDTKGSLLYIGTPLGYEFMTLIDGIVDASRGKTRLSADTIASLKKLTDAASIKVFVTPSCPHCPVAARLAQQFGMVNPLIRAEVIEASEFPELSDQYYVSSVPKSVINEDREVIGGMPEAQYLEEFLAAVATAN